MKKNVQHDFILTQILQEIRELRKDVEYIKLHYEQNEAIVIDNLDFSLFSEKEKIDYDNFDKTIDFLSLADSLVKTKDDYEYEKVIENYKKKHGASCDANNLYLNYISKFKKYFLGE